VNGGRRPVQTLQFTSTDIALERSLASRPRIGVPATRSVRGGVGVGSTIDVGQPVKPMFCVRSSIAVAFTLLFATSSLAQVAPQNLAAVVNGTTVTLSWTASAGPVTGYLVEASVVPSGPLVASLPVGGTTLVVPNVPPGVYFVRVRSLNGGAQSAPSNEVTVSVTGGTGCPAAPLPPQLIVRATGFNVTLNWGSSCRRAPRLASRISRRSTPADNSG
jgi:hypothetical protein